MGFGSFLKKQRIKKPKAMSQSELAEGLGYTTSQFISNIERDKARLPLDKMKRFMKLTDTSPVEVEKVLVELYRKKIRPYLY